MFNYFVFNFKTCAVLFIIYFDCTAHLSSSDNTFEYNKYKVLIDKSHSTIIALECHEKTVCRVDGHKAQVPHECCMFLLLV